VTHEPRGDHLAVGRAPGLRGLQRAVRAASDVSGAEEAQDASIEEKHGRGGWYFGNNGFRPAADLQLYLEEAHQSADSNLLGDADIVLAVPFAFDILFFGYNHATDVVTANEAEEE
jgi:hypothetical protein